MTIVEEPGYLDRFDEYPEIEDTPIGEDYVPIDDKENEFYGYAISSGE